MSADRIEIECRDGYVIIDGCEYFDHGDFRTDMIDALRQQARDIAEWDRLFTAVVSQSLPNAPSLWPFDGEQGPAMVAFAIYQLRTDLAAAVTRAEQAEARLAAIGNAPTVATVIPDGDCSILDYYDLPPIGTELIARPAKD